MSKKILIIGGGVAGLSAGIYARLNGFDAEIAEMHSITGGQCTAWDRKGYRFDYCLHWLVGTRKGPFNDIWKETGVLNDNVEIIDHEIHTKVYADDGSEFILFTNLDKWEAYLISLAPDDSDSIRKMCTDMRKSAFLQPYSDPPGIRKLSTVLKSGFSMMPVIALFMKYGKKNTNEYFDRLGFKNEKLKSYFRSIFGSRDFSALAFIMMFAWFNQKNAGYLIGGSLPMARRMTDRFLGLGGVLTSRTRIEKIIVEDGVAKGAVTSDGRTIYADYVISAADGYSTIFRMLEGKFVSKKITHAYKNWELFTPLVQVSFGLRKMYPSDTPVESWIKNGLKIGMTPVENGYSLMNYWFDRTMAPEGKSVIVMRFESPWKLWEGLAGDAYKMEKAAIEKEARELLEKRYPGISGEIELCDVATPLTDVSYTGVWKGSYEGFLPSSKNMMDNLPPRLPGLKKFYMAGQWLFPGGGLPPAGQSGKWAIQFICREERKEFRATEY
jgi:phytoene dehydrogenase-like protein